MDNKKFAFAVIPLISLMLGPGIARADACTAVEREMVWGQAAAEDAKDETGYLDSAKQFMQAAAKAPNCAQAHYNAGLMYEKAGAYAQAIPVLQRYIQLMPNAPDAKAVQRRIYALEYRANKKTQAKKVDVSGFGGNWCNALYCSQSSLPTNFYSVRIDGNRFFARSVDRSQDPGGYTHVTANEFTGTVDGEGNIKGQYKFSYSHSGHCNGAPLKDEYPFEGRLTNETVDDKQGRPVKGGAVVLKWRTWSPAYQDYDNCRYVRSNRPGRNGTPAGWRHDAMVLKRRTR